VDAHLDVRPLVAEQGHSGSPFRQAMEHPTHPLKSGRYVCLGAQPQAVSRQHIEFVRQRGGVILWAERFAGELLSEFQNEIWRLANLVCPVYVTIDADVVRAADAPGVSAPNPVGLDGTIVAACARLAGESPAVQSMDVVEVNPRYDRDGQSSRWAAVVVWNFLAGLAARAHHRAQ
jgi:formiminoglutamase